MPFSLAAAPFSERKCATLQSEQAVASRVDIDNPVMANTVMHTISTDRSRTKTGSSNSARTGEKAVEWGVCSADHMSGVSDQDEWHALEPYATYHLIQQKVGLSYT